MYSTRREQSIYHILEASLELFRQNTYHATTVRQIAEKSNVALGMVNHYFGSKEYLGAQVLSLLDYYACTPLSSPRVSMHVDPILYDLVAVRLLFNYLRNHGYWGFYLDSLQNDFFFNSLSKRPLLLINLLREHYTIDTDPDSILLYSRYLPYMMEKTIILKKEEGLFPSVPYENVPYLICHTAMNHFIPEADIEARNQDSIQIAEDLGRTLEDLPPQKIITEFVQQFESSL